MKKERIQMFVPTDELVKMAEKHQDIDALLSVFPNNMGINLCSVIGIDFTVTNDEYGQLVSLKVEFTPSEDKELLEQGKNEYGVKPWYDLWRCQEMKKEG